MIWNRRNVIKSMTLAGITLPFVEENSASDLVKLPPGLRIVFQGDSITDGGRNRNFLEANDSRGMGNGYVRLVSSELLGLHPDNHIRIFNRGISGNKVYQLAERWNEDCLLLEPDVLSILIGVNDYWHTLTNKYKGTAEVYEKDLRSLIDLTMYKLPDVKLIIGEPFVLLNGTAINDSGWSASFPSYRQIARSVAKDYNAGFIPYQSIFERALKKADTSYWCPDGVHPSMAGTYLMTNAWLEAFYSIYE